MRFLGVLIIYCVQSIFSALAASDSREQFATADPSIASAICLFGGAAHYATNRPSGSAIPGEDVIADARVLTGKEVAAINAGDYDCALEIAPAAWLNLSFAEEITRGKLPAGLAQLESEEMPGVRQDSTDDKSNPLAATIAVVIGIPLLDGVFEQLSELQADDPNNWGILYGLFGVPYAIGLFANNYSESTAAPWIAGGLTAAFAAYLISLDEEKYSEEEISEKIHDATWAYVLTGTAAFYLLDKSEKEKRSSFIDIGPTPYGAEFRLVYQF